MKKDILNIFKPEGMTSRQALEVFRNKNPEYMESILGYAGTLDPLASGVLIVLVGDENKSRKSFVDLPKEYTFSCVLGFTTDTFDILGLVSNVANSVTVTEVAVREAIEGFLGEVEQVYPPYSSKKVLGKRLFEWARLGKILEIAIPKKRRTIFESKLESFAYIDTKTLLKTIEEKITKVSGDFRQKEIISCWRDVLSGYKNVKWSIVEGRVICSSGTYIRGLVDELGKSLGCGATTFSIHRKKVGTFTDIDSLKI